MFSRLIRTRAGCVGVGLLLALTAASSAAGIPDNLTDIPYQSTEWGSEQLRFRGFTLTSSDDHDGRTYEYWWQASSSTCIQARAKGSRYESLATTSGTDCNQYHAAANKDDAAAAVAIGAAALIGAALVHQSHERDNKHDDQKSVAEFDRGYRDGLYREPYHNYSNTTAYSDGFTAGNREREEQTSYRPRHGAYSGYQSYVYLDDLVGTRASNADSGLRSRGFVDTGAYQQGGRSFTTWYNRNTRQCVQVVTHDGRIKRVEGIDEGNCL